MKYENRITIYLDILGFKEWIDTSVKKNNADNPEAIQMLNLQYKRIKRAFEDEGKSLGKYQPWYLKETKSKMITVFSDSIVVSFLAAERKDTWHIIVRLHRMIRDMIYTSDYLFRGAITIGKLIHTKSVLFGPALVRAYELESQKAIYPRIIIDPKCVRLIKRRKHNDPDNPRFAFGLNDLLALDIDKLYYIDYFNILDPLDSSDIWYLESLRDRICYGLEESKYFKNERIFQKYKWMANKFNKELPLHVGKIVPKYLSEKNTITCNIKPITI